MDGYLYIVIVFVLLFKFSIYFCWYKARRQRYVTAQRTYIIDTSAVSNPGFGQANVMPPAVHGQQGMVEQPVAPYFQPSMANQGKPPTYNETGQQPKGMHTTEPPPPSYFNATTFPYSTNVSGVPSIPAATGGPTNPGLTPYPYTTMASGPTTPYSYPATTGGPTSPGTTPYRYPATAGGQTSLGTTPYPAGTNSGPQQM
ncbi:nascent polypeptide-associated complex subunit alpha, muscle-specific form-like isoform X2 [Anneissia japonica]|nr:nascent polypeptide-associated complex subunit alpha, muscle-specific form-like isoform X2 [Anneissia japonica]